MMVWSHHIDPKPGSGRRRPPGTIASRFWGGRPVQNVNQCEIKGQESVGVSAEGAAELFVVSLEDA